jgi:phosphoglycerate dehydrogenase-like enzyme
LGRELSAHLLRAPEPAPLECLLGLLDEGIDLTFGPEPPEPSEYEILVAGRPERRHVAASARLRALIIPWSGLPEATRALMREFPHVAVHNLHYNAAAASELALALLLATAKGVVTMDGALRKGDWRPRYRPSVSVLLEGKRALILGYGAIGRRIARALRGLGMTVAATRRSIGRRGSEGPDEIHPPEALPSLLPGADVVFVCLPLTDETKGMIGARELALLPDGAILVNVARGPIVDEEALYRALRDGALAAAGIDVWYNYPGEEVERRDTAPSAFPFHELPNVVMSPHRAGALGMEEGEILRVRDLARLLNAEHRGEPLPNRVDLERGY